MGYNPTLGSGDHRDAAGKAGYSPRLQQITALRLNYAFPAANRRLPLFID